MLLATLAALVLPATATAGPALVTNAYPLPGAGSELALTAGATLIGGTEGERASVVRSFAPGRPPKVVARVRLRLASPESGQMFFAASPTRLVLRDRGSSATYRGAVGVHFERLESGPLGGPLQELPGECRLAPGIDETVGTEGGFPAHTAVAIDGEVLAYDSYGCVIVHDFASGLTRVIGLQATLDPVFGDQASLETLGSETLMQVAGGLLAYRENAFGGGAPAYVVVYDIDAGRELYRVRLPADYRPYFDVSPTFALQADGALLIADARSCTATISTLADPAPRPLGIPACSVQGLREGRALLIVPEGRYGRVLAWSALESPVANPIVNLGPGASFQAATPQMNATEVVYALAGCTAPSVYRAPLAEPGAALAPPASCPVRLSTAHAVLTPRGFSVRLRCPEGCEGEVHASVGTRRQLRREDGGDPTEATFSIPRAQTRRIALEAQSLAGETAEVDPCQIMRRLLAHHRLRLGVELTIATPLRHSSGPDTGLRLITETRTHRLVPIWIRRAARCRRRERHS